MFAEYYLRGHFKARAGFLRNRRTHIFGAGLFAVALLCKRPVWENPCVGLACQSRNSLVGWCWCRREAVDHLDARWTDAARPSTAELEAIKAVLQNNRSKRDRELAPYKAGAFKEYVKLLGTSVCFATVSSPSNSRDTSCETRWAIVVRVPDYPGWSHSGFVTFIFRILSSFP